MSAEEETKEATGRAAGGVARAESLSAEQRRDIATKAAEKRWANQKQPTDEMPRVMEGYSSYLELVDTRLPCAVIEWPDGRIQRVLSENGIANAILGGRSGASKRLKSGGSQHPLFLAPRQLEPFIPTGEDAKAFQPIEYVDGSRVVRGYDAEIIVEVCAIWLRARAEGALQKQQLTKAQKAEELTLALANTGVAGLIDEATGYQDDRAKDALAKIFVQFLAKERQKWTLTFPLDFYREIYRLRGWDFEPWNTKRPQVIAKWTDDFVYDRLAPGLTDELREKNPTGDTGRRTHKHHQWFNPHRGHPKLKEHIAGVTALLRAAETWEEFKRKLDRVYPKFGETIEMKLDRPDKP